MLAFLTNATTLLAMVYSVYRTLVTHTMLLGDCLIVLNLFGEVSDNAQNLARILSWVDETALHVEDYRALMEKRPALAAPDAPLPTPALADIQALDIRFAYSGSQTRAIDGLTLDVKPGERIALVGENGAGKTTLVKLLLRLYDVQAGTVRAGGHDIRLYDPGRVSQALCRGVAGASTAGGVHRGQRAGAQARPATRPACATRLKRWAYGNRSDACPGASTRR